MYIAELSEEIKLWVWKRLIIEWIGKWCEGAKAIWSKWEVNEVQSLYDSAKAIERNEGELSKLIWVLRWRSKVMSPWLFNMYVGGDLREVKANVVGMGATLRKAGREWVLPELLLAEFAVLVCDDEIGV